MAETRQPTPADQGGLVVAGLGVVLCGAVAAVYAPLMTALIGVLLSTDPTLPRPTAIGLGIVPTILALMVGLLAFLVSLVAATGVVLRQPWGWVIGVLLGIALLGTGCLPVGLIVLVALLAPGPRQLVFPPVEPAEPAEAEPPAP